VNKKVKKKIEVEEQVAKVVKLEGSLNILRKLRSILQFSLRQERRSLLMIKL
jgi:hypothetical protein